MQAHPHMINVQEQEIHGNAPPPPPPRAFSSSLTVIDRSQTPLPQMHPKTYNWKLDPRNPCSGKSVGVRAESGLARAAGQKQLLWDHRLST